MTTHRFFEFLPGTLSWLTLILMVLLSWLLPGYISIFIILFDIYWLLKTIYLSLHLRSTFSIMKKNLKVDWLGKLKNLDRDANNANSIRMPRIVEKELSDAFAGWDRIYHLVILPMYREPYEVVRESFESLVKGNYPLEKFIVILATEETGGAEAAAVAKKIENEFGSKFFKFMITSHPAGLPGEIPGKGSNETWAVKQAKRLVIDPMVDTQTNADHTLTNAENQTNTEDEFLYEDLSYKIRGAIFSVRKKLGLGHKEVVYQKALEEEFIRLGLKFEKEKTVDVLYENKKVGIYRPDFVIEEKIILELKALPFVSKLEKRQVWQYLKGSNYKLALLVNFGGNDIYIKRIVYDTARQIQRESASSLRRSALSYENILVSVFDVDTQIFPEYFGRLTYVFLKAESRLRAIYQPIPLFVNNIYQAPALARVISFSSTFWQMMQQSRPERLTSFSSQSIPFPALLDIGYWQTDVVSEDSRSFWQCFLRYHGDFRVEPLFYPVSMDANAAPTFWGTLKNNYRQHRRWAWGCENIPYLLEGFRKDKLIPFRKKIYWAFNSVEGFHSWATNALLIFALGWLPVILGGRHFNLSLMSYSLPSITRFIVEASMIGVATSAFFSILLLPPRYGAASKSESRPDGRSPRLEPLKWHQYIWHLAQWLLLPLTLIVFGCVPALESQTRMMLGGKWHLGFWVTPKTRNQKNYGS